MKYLKILGVIFAFALLVGCGMEAPQETTAPPTETAQLPSGEPAVRTEPPVTEPEDAIPWEALERLNISMNPTGGAELRAMVGDEVLEWSVPAADFSAQVLSQLPECTALKAVVCTLLELPAEEQPGILEAILNLQAMEQLALQGSACDLAPLEACKNVNRLSFIQCDLSTLPATNATWMIIESSTGMDWSRLTEQEKLDTLILDGTGMPETFDPICAHPTLRSVVLVTEDPDALGGTPVVFTDPDGEIPEELGIPYTTEELRAFLRRGNAEVQILINS